jgi:hypothetical protein
MAVGGIAVPGTDQVPPGPKAACRPAPQLDLR